ncbi:MULTISPECIES: tRNA (N6-isopentenyl adenosine(37)-C2)-methylthiotransferase MiaB [Staphylococcus]|uniref:tRNA (N6-isopentenyl adenosine(37)-C2)-methylthiotransferase MiaB n=1 Tax=Staphylococcus TaxID=1279 RepID=UPI000852C235|nr:MULTISPECIES: tRNA (N6-isopentenyl adenosine(37)-C2)-methylthiotransferase MiaB [Staphylococcus]MBN6755721.1 tRNA (N6-isopentenyl adenosine(37)-C2)-methylthiotransferase MiaB [Staphylococcus saprophyticus]MBN6765699.1 tRNA (N6-isopentenyl adenosine(37)-C2)-methylthiotransferase MiaB [Staphylococcus saprophyticus]MBN6770506.1 tRNA (N6-isopentenyl adenosine(37)-C2)-methylthiotransferase MiaB [Staphylococcus saprophyticus]MBN6779021.1 tRNA (N6-isopentenyl adenosine(37)-C2)-methylthiotransferase
MNEEQRKNTSIDILAERDKKTKDYSKYFEHVYQPPSLKEARKRGKEEVNYNDDFQIDEKYRNMGQGKTFLIKTYGCQMNAHDTEVMAGILGALGYTPTEDINHADVILINTCAIRENAENKVFSEIGNLKHLKKEKPETVIGVCGCMSQEESVVNKILKSYQNVDMIFGTHNIHRLPEILEEAYLSKAMVVEVWSKEGDVIENLPKVREGNIKAWVNIMYGCDKFCTYCIVPFTRGKERSRRPEDIIDEVRDLARQGYKEITLLGQNVNAYGKDIDGLAYGLGDLLEDISKIDIPRVRFTTSHPWDFTDRMIEVIANGGNIVPHVHLPVQSGNNAVLKIMGRKYTRESYLDLVNRIKTHIPNVALTTDIIVGYPNETDEQFEETLTLYDEVEFEHAYTYIYSQRDGTPAAKMNDNVPLDVKKDRLQQLNKKVACYSERAMQQYEGQTVQVLCEGVSKKDDTVLSGYTSKNKLVNFKAPKSMIGKIVNVYIDEAKQFSLNGTFISVNDKTVVTQ